MPQVAPPLSSTYVTLTTKFNHRKAYKPDYVSMISQKFDDKLEEGLDDDIADFEPDEGDSPGGKGFMSPGHHVDGKVMSEDSEDEVIRGNVRGRH